MSRSFEFDSPRTTKTSTACLFLGLLLASWSLVIASADDSPKVTAPNFRSVLMIKQKELLHEATSYLEQHPTASDRDETLAWALGTARQLGLEADVLSLAEKSLAAKSIAPALQPLAKQIVCVGLAKSGKLREAVSAFQETLQFARLGSASEPLDLAVELAAQAGLAGEHATARNVYEIVSNRFGLNPQVGEFCENRLKKLELVGVDAPELELTDLLGKPAKISEHRGKVLLIDFWATNCPPCLAEFPKLKQLYADYHEKGFEVIGLSLDESRNDVDAFQARVQLPWRLVAEADQVRQAREKYRVRTIPSLFLVGRDGRIAQVDLKSHDLRQAVERCLTEK